MKATVQLNAAHRCRVSIRLTAMFSRTDRTAVAKINRIDAVTVLFSRVPIPRFIC